MGGQTRYVHWLRRCKIDGCFGMFGPGILQDLKLFLCRAWVRDPSNTVPLRRIHFRKRLLGHVYSQEVDLTPLTDVLDSRAVLKSELEARPAHASTEEEK